MKSLSRNLPITLLVGAAGFLGSHLTDKLLSEGVQVVGVDDLSTGDLDNLASSARDNHFQFIKQSLLFSLSLNQLPRLDYAVFIINETLPQKEMLVAVENFLRAIVEFKPKILLVSSIKLYEAHYQTNLKEVEGKVAKFAEDNKLNARVVRLSAVYGPRMHFREDDPIIKLVDSQARGELQKELPSLDFTTRALYISDAVSLLEKSLFHGATAHKIYDGCLINPLKVSEIKQVLLDPLWHENTSFLPAALPPWVTPNLERTMRELSWRPVYPLARSLKETVNYFTDHQNKIRESYQSIPRDVPRIEEPLVAEVSLQPTKKDPPRLDLTPLTTPFKKYTPMVIGTALIIYALVVPIANMVVGSFMVRQSIVKIAEDINTRQFADALVQLEKAKAEFGEVDKARSSYLVFEALRVMGVNLSAIDDLISFQSGTIDVSSYAINSSQSLAQTWGAFSGADDNDVLGVTNTTQAATSSLISSLGFLQSLPRIPLLDVLGLGANQQQLANYSQLANIGRILSSILSEISLSQGSYLVALIDNRVLRPGGGLVMSVARVDIKSGRVEKVEVFKVGDLDKKLTEVVEPPADLKKDTVIKNWSLKEAMVEADFTLNAQNILWFYEKQTGVKPLGVIAVDLTTLNSEFKGDLTEEEGLRLSLEKTVNNLLYVPQTNLITIGENLQTATKRGGIRMYFVNSKLQTMVSSLNWDGSIKEDGWGWVESDVKSSGVFGQIKRAALIRQKINPIGKVATIVELKYSNQSQEFLYESRLKLYTPQGWKLLAAGSNGQSIKGQVSNFSDYGLAGYSSMVQLLPKEQKTIVLEFEKTGQLVGEFDHILRVFKQPGILTYPLTVIVSYPAEMTVIKMGEGSSKEGSVIKWDTDLDQDKQFVITFKVSP